MEKTAKERNTQRRKRRTGLMKKAFFLSKLCELDVLLLIYDPESDSYNTFRSSERAWPDLATILSHPKSNNKVATDLECTFTSGAGLRKRRKERGLEPKSGTKGRERPKFSKPIPKAPRFDLALLDPDRSEA